MHPGYESQEMAGYRHWNGLTEYNIGWYRACRLCFQRWEWGRLLYLARSALTVGNAANLYGAVFGILNG